MSKVTENDLMKYRKKTEPRLKSLQKTEERKSFYEDKGKVSGGRIFSDNHALLYDKSDQERKGHTGIYDREDQEMGTRASLPEKALKDPLHPAARTYDEKDFLKGALQKTSGQEEESLRLMLADTAAEMQNYLQPEKRTGSNVNSVKAKLTELERALKDLNDSAGGLSPEYAQLIKSVRQKKRQLEAITLRNDPVNPEALRSFEEVGEGTHAKDAADLVISALYEDVTGILTGRKSTVDGMSTEDLAHLVSETDAMRSRHRYTKEQQSLGVMEQESLGRGFIRSNRVLQEVNETKHGSRVRRETGVHGENEEIFEKQKGAEERDALGQKYAIMKKITRTNQNSLRREKENEGLDAVQGMMHNGERGMGYAPLAAMGLGGNLYRGFSGVNFMMSMTNAAVDRNRKRAEIQGLAERYLGLDNLYRNFMTKNSDLRNRSAFLKRYGMEGNVRVMIRKEQERALGIGRENRVHSFMMEKYARELWKGAFLKEDGSVITEQERMTEEPQKKQRRKLYADMLRAMGFQIRYPNAEGELPGTSAAEIFRRLTR